MIVIKTHLRCFLPNNSLSRTLTKTKKKTDREPLLYLFRIVAYTIALYLVVGWFVCIIYACIRLLHSEICASICTFAYASATHRWNNVHDRSTESCDLIQFTFVQLRSFFNRSDTSNPPVSKSVLFCA